MDLLPTDEQADLVVVVRDFLARELPPAAAPAIRAGDRFQELWSSIAELGWFGLSVPEAAGGLGFGLVEEALLFIELGRGVAPGPFLSTSLACQLALSGGSAELLAELIAGESRAGLAIPLADRDDGDDEAPYLVVDGHDHRCRHLIVQRPGRLELVTAPPLDALTAVPSIDEGTTLAEARSGLGPTLHLAGVRDAERIHLRATILSAAMLAGIAEATRDTSVDHAKVRHQFNRPIGSFQAVSRRCADMAARAWSATSLTLFAALCTDAGRDDRDYQAAAAKWVAADAATRNAADNIQNLGAIGVTAEHDAHLFFKRARVINTIWGDNRHNEYLLVEGRSAAHGLGGTGGSELRAGTRDAI